MRRVERRGIISGTLLALLAGLLGLLAVPATLQYRWLGMLSDAERDRVRSGLNHAATRFCDDADRELVRAFMTFLAALRAEGGTVDVHIASLRQKVEPNPAHPQYIVTVHRLGYRFDGREGAEGVLRPALHRLQRACIPLKTPRARRPTLRVVEVRRPDTVPGWHDGHRRKGGYDHETHAGNHRCSGPPGGAGAPRPGRRRQAPASGVGWTSVW